MRKHRGTTSGHDKHVTLEVISPPGVARGRFVGGHQSALAGRKSPSLFMRGASSCSSQRRHQGEPWGASPRPSAPTYLPCQSFKGNVNVLFVKAHTPWSQLVEVLSCGRRKAGLFPIEGFSFLFVHLVVNKNSSSPFVCQRRPQKSPILIELVVVEQDLLSGQRHC